MDQQNQSPKQAIASKLQDSKNILVTVTSNPNVDQLAALLGLTLWLNKTDKHATAVFSGEVPSTLEFLEPEDTLEKNTDSLRDFIISLDKSKADKLRYKVEDSVVKVFVTPYRTSLSADDLEFSQGDFNVDMVVALGVHNQDELDAAITAHGRILHDATVATITIGDQASELGSIGWHDQQASSLSELVVDLANAVDQSQIDSQIATALLTGIVAETERFSNAKTTPQTMSASAQLMSAGANQQLVATKLEEPAPVAEPAIEEEQTDEPIAALPEPEQPADDTPADDGSITIAHEGHEDDEQPTDDPEEAPDEPLPTLAELEESVHSQHGEPFIGDVKETAPDEAANDDNPELKHFSDPKPRLSANLQEDDETAEGSSDPMSQATNSDEPLLDHDAMQPAPPDWMPSQPWMDGSSHPTGSPADNPETMPQPPQQPVDDLDAARDEVLKAINAEPTPEQSVPEPVQALNAMPIDLDQPTTEPQSTVTATQFDPTSFGVPPSAPAAEPAAPADPNQPIDPNLTGPVEQPFTMPLPTPADASAPPSTPPPSTGSTPPPPVPPPMPYNQ